MPEELVKSMHLHATEMLMGATLLQKLRLQSLFRHCRLRARLFPLQGRLYGSSKEAKKSILKKNRKI